MKIATAKKDANRADCEGIFSGVFVCSLGAAQNPQPANSNQAPGQTPAIKSEVRLVLVDVVVTGKKGETVAGAEKRGF